MNEKNIGNVLTVRGTAKIDRETGDMNFRAYQEGRGPAKEVLKKRGDSQLYLTLGEKESSMVAHLRVKSDVADPVAQLYDDLGYVTKGMLKQEPKVPKTYMLLDKEGVKVSHRPIEKVVTVHLTINLDGESELSAKLFNLTSEVSKCFAINRKRLTPTT